MATFQMEFLLRILPILTPRFVQQTSKTNADDEMLRYAPRHAIEVFRREDCPYEQMSSQHSTCKHDEDQAACREASE